MCLCRILCFVRYKCLVFNAFTSAVNISPCLPASVRSFSWLINFSLRDSPISYNKFHISRGIDSNQPRDLTLDLGQSHLALGPGMGMCPRRANRHLDGGAWIQTHTKSHCRTGGCIMNQKWSGAKKMERQNIIWSPRSIWNQSCPQAV